MKKGIKSPKPNVWSMILEPFRWTINRERNMCLIDSDDTKDEIGTHYFTFMKEDSCIFFKMKYATKSNYHVVWRLDGVLDRSQIPLSYVKEDILEAFQVFKVFGSTRKQVQETIAECYLGGY